MGGSIAPWSRMSGPTENRREFNFWWDPEAVHMVYTAPWHKITITTVDISVKTAHEKSHDRRNRKITQPRRPISGKIC